MRWFVKKFLMWTSFQGMGGMGGLGDLWTWSIMMNIVAFFQPYWLETPFFFLFLVESFYSNQRVCRHKIIWSNLIVLRLGHLPTTQQWSSEEVEQDKPRLVQLHFLDIFHLYNRIFETKIPVKCCVLIKRSVLVVLRLWIYRCCLLWFQQ